MQTFKLAVGLALIMTATLGSIAVLSDQDGMGIIMILGAPAFLVGFVLTLSALPAYLAQLRNQK